MNMFEEGISQQWLRRAAWATYLFFGLFALLGLAYVWYAAAGGAVLHALVGAGVALGSLGLGIGMHCIVQLARVVAENGRQVEEFHQRIDALEQALNSSEMFVRLPATDSGEPASLVAGDVKASQYPRLAQSESAPGDSPEPEIHAETESPEGPSVDASGLVAAEPLPMDILRATFRESVYAGDFAGAIEVGEAIAAGYPKSKMADQFRHLRPLLAERSRQAGLNPVREDDTAQPSSPCKS
jgi:hypothetical protein